MRFIEPAWLWALLAAPLWVVVDALSHRARRRALARFAGGAERLPEFVVEVSPNRRAIRTILVALAIAGIAVAAARPQWGTRLEQIERRGVDVALVLDTSRSMASEDVAPSRFHRARESVRGLLRRLGGDRVAFVTFAGYADIECPLTLDTGAAELFLDTTRLRSTHGQGTAFGEALRAAHRALEPDREDAADRTRAVVLFSDGEDHEEGIREAAEALEAAGAVVYTVGIGTAEGGPIPVRDRSGNVRGYKKDAEGKVVTTRLEERILRGIADRSGGRYFRSTPGGLEIEEIATAIANLEGGELGSVMRTRYEERYQIPLTIALLCLVAELVIPDRGRGRVFEPARSKPSGERAA